MKRCAVFVTILLLLAGCSWGMNYPKRYAPPPIPDYPNAQNVTRQTQAAYVIATTNFDTTDTPDVVYKFYDDQLPRQQQDGWKLTDSSPPGKPHKYSAIGCINSFFLTVEAAPNGASMTRVTLSTAQEAWCY
jgi:hypothetical protein